MSASYLGRFYDPGADIDAALPQRAVEREQIERVARALAVVLYASSIPRRLGSDANAEELALDKRRCRRVAHALKQALVQWSNHKNIELPSTEEIRREGAQLDWSRWGSEHLAKTRDCARWVVTWAMRQDPPKERWAKSAVVHFENEINWIEYALR